jgi:NTE family protein
MHPAKIGLALGGGAARGWAHIGVIEALHEAGVKIDVVCGSSMGALVGAAYVAGKLTALKEWALTLNLRRITALLDVRLNGGGLLNGAAIMRQLRSIGLDGMIEDYPTPFAAVAAELATGHEVWFRDGPIEEAVRASIALPGILSPAKVDSRWMLDGGLVNPVPVSACRALGADVIIAVDLNADFFQARGSATATARSLLMAEADPPPLAPPSSKPVDVVLRLLQRHGGAPGYFEVLITAVNIMQDQITRARLAGEPPQVLLIPRVGAISPLDFHRVREGIDRGRSAVEHALRQLRQAIAPPLVP